jgi:hypothetical protein
MGKNQSASGLTNIVQYDTAGNISLVSGSTTLLYISSSGAIITTGIISGSNALSASYAISASNALNASTASFVQNAQSASYVLTAQTASFVALAQSASNAVAAQTASFANAFTVAGTLTAQTLVVQTITSSVDFVTGSTRFGSIIGNTHAFTGSVGITGSIVTDGIITSNTTVGAALPSASGTSQSNGLRLRLTTVGSSTAVIDYGTAGGSGGWIQATNKSDLSLNYGLLLNPNGGGVAIGATTPRASLQVSNSTSGIPSIPSLGQSGSYTSLYVTNLNSLYGLLMGSLNNGNSWIQVQRTDGTATAYDLQLQPNGGSVVMGGTAKIRGVSIYGASGGYTTGDNTYINLGDSSSPDTFGAINMPFGDRMKLNSYHGFEFKTSNATASPITMVTIGLNGTAIFNGGNFGSIH